MRGPITIHMNYSLMRNYITFLFIVGLLFDSSAQKKYEKSIPWKAGQKLVLDFDYVDLKIHTWDKSEVGISGSVSVNRGENDDAFELTVEQTAGQVKLLSSLKDKEKIPQRITIKKGEEEFYFKATSYNDPEVQKFLEANGHQYSYISMGIDTDIQLEIFVPKGTETSINSKYGLVEVTGFDAPLSVDAKYGKIDASIVAQSIGELTARSRHGEILTNLDIKFDQAPMSKQEKWTVITARPGKGPAYWFESKYGNVYLRKP
jgi:hypothetical protein